MKTFVAAMVALFVIFAGSIVYILALDRTVDGMEQHLDAMSSAAEAEDWKECEAELESFLEQYDKTHSILCMFIDHQELDLVLQSIYGIRGHIAFQDREKTVTELGVLKILLRKIPENEKPTWENIL